MRDWQRRVIGILTLGGSFLGLAVGLQHLAETDAALGKAFVAGFCALYGYGVWIGLRLLEQAPRATRAASVYWFVQVPCFMSPLVGYLFASGASMLVSWTFGQGAGYRWQFGSSFRYSLMQPDTPWLLGINVFALAVALYLAAVSQRKPAAEAAPNRRMRRAASNPTPMSTSTSTSTTDPPQRRCHPPASARDAPRR
jgi:hypothetical protein